MMTRSSTITGDGATPLIAHLGRLLRRELEVRGLSANRLALGLGVPSGSHHGYPERPALDYR
jgi:hypothetical protein